MERAGATLRQRHSASMEEIQDTGHSATNHGELTTTNALCGAFTLAEVLITLGIIGVVAAMTIPNLMSAYRKHVVETRLARTYSILKQAERLSIIDNGEISGWDTISAVLDGEGNLTTKDSAGNNGISAWFRKYYAPYLKNLDIKDVRHGAIAVTLIDGSLLEVHPRYTYYFPIATDFDNSLEQAVYKKQSGRKFFVFHFYPDLGFETYGHNRNNDLLYDSVDGCIANTTNEPACCTTVIKRNGWKIPKDYPFKL